MKEQKSKREGSKVKSEKKEIEKPCENLFKDIRTDKFVCKAGNVVVDITECFDLPKCKTVCFHRYLADKIPEM